MYSNPRSKLIDRPLHVNTLQTAGDTNGIFQRLFDHLQSKESEFPNGIKLHSIFSNPSGLADGAFITFRVPPKTYLVDFISWVMQEARAFDIFGYSLSNIPSSSEVLVIRIYIP